MIVRCAILLVLIGAVNSILDPEITMTAPQIINRWGYPAEEINAVTEDGYILTMHRIPYGKDGPSANRPVIFLQHGLEDSSVSWIINSPTQSAGFIFADAGFDVWLGNMRGNAYSRNHVSLDPKSKEFWKFSFDEMVKYDLDTMINTALKKTNQTSLYYAGHSQGTLTMFSRLSRGPNFHQKIRKSFMLAPVGTVKHIKGMLDILANLLFDELKFFYYLLGDGEFLPTGDLFTLIAKYICETYGREEFCDNLMMMIMGGDSEFVPSDWIISELAEYVCAGFWSTFCDDFVMLIMGTDSNQLSKERAPIYLSHISAGTSTKNFVNWSQMVRSGLMAEYNYKKDGNLLHYGTDGAPIYDIDATTKINLYWSPSDWLADQKDATGFLLTHLPATAIAENNMLLDFNHVDFLWGDRATEEVYKPILKSIRENI